MNSLAVLHRPKSEYAYAYDVNHLHILLRTQKDDVSSVFLRCGDPFLWDRTSEPYRWIYEDVKMEIRYQTADYDYYFVELQPQYKRLQYAFLLQDQHDRYVYSPDGMRSFSVDDEITAYFKFPYLHQDDLHQTPTWVKHQIWYQIFCDRFYSGEQSSLSDATLPVKNTVHYGGTLHGIHEKLDYLKDLGVTAIYLTPLFESPTAHKYDTANYFKIDPHFGSEEDLKKLVKKAHVYHMKVMLDGVFNHAGFFHPFFQDVIKNGEKSLYKDCFYIDEFPVINFPLDPSGKPMNYHGIPLRYRTFSFQPNMPKWNTSHPLVEKHLLDVVSYWIEKTDIDGWRLDVSNELSHAFLRKIKDRARSLKNDVFILGENWDESLPWLMGDQLDSVMNYELSYIIWGFISHQITNDELINRMMIHHAKTPKNVLMNLFNLLGSHDTMRIDHRCHGDIKNVILSYLLMYLSSGTPMIYYGDEIGLKGDHDPDNRRLFDWDEDHWNKTLLMFIKKLNNLRKTHFDLLTSDFHFLSHPDVLIFTKSINNKHLLCIINHAKEKEITLQENLFGDYHDLINEQKIRIHDKIKIDAPSFYLLYKEDV
jgi:glycosidase